MMKTIFALGLTAFLIISCQRPDKDQIKEEIFQAEKAFEKMAAEKGVAESFYYFADKNAVIKRERDTLIVGNENIKAYYLKNENNKNATVNWTPDFIDVADDGSLAYTYGKYAWKIINPEGDTTSYKGVFHTVWKKQIDGSWKYVWD